MRIKKIHIIKYGPINGLELNIGPGLQVVRGRNEAGKTLTIDAVIKMLLRGRTRDYGDVDRVEGDPEGFILFEENGGKEHKVNIKNGLAKFIELGGADLRNIFIIRDSDLSMSDGPGYFKNITDRLTGLQTQKIALLMDLVKDYGMLTKPSSDASLSDSKEYGKILSILSEARSFEKESMDYIKRSSMEKLDYTELERIEASKKIKEKRVKIRNFGIASEWERYKKFTKNMEQLKKNWDLYKQLNGFNQDNYDRISDIIRGIDSYKEKVSRLKQDRKEKILQRNDLDEKFFKVKNKADLLEIKIRDIERLKSEIEIYNRRKAEEIKEPGRIPIIFIIILFVLAVLVFPMVYVPTANIAISFILPAVFTLTAVLLIFLLYRPGRTYKKFLVDKKLLENEFKKIGFRINDIEEAQPEIAIFEDKYREICRERDSMKEKINLADMENKTISDEGDRIKGEIRELELKLGEVFGELGIKSIDEFREKHRYRNSIGSELMASVKMFQELPSNKDDEAESYFDPGDLTERMDDLISRWEKDIGELKPIEEPQGGKYFEVDHKYLEVLKKELENLEDEKNKLDMKLEDHRNMLDEFQRRFLKLNINSYIDNYNRVDISNLERLKEASDIIKRFIEVVEERKNIALESLKIIEDIRIGEESKISDLFDRMKASEIFGSITEGKYNSVKFNSQFQKVMVTDEHGRELEAGKLSKGAYDQLFLAIRVAISEKIMGDRSGFFIIDDAFLSSDKFRLNKQFEVLAYLAERGWSIIYFTVKDEVAELAKKFTKNQIIDI
jgi:DNA repair protein SbcC/Rad50